jgi:hypothetical protein
MEEITAKLSIGWRLSIFAIFLAAPILFFVYTGNVSWSVFFGIVLSVPMAINVIFWSKPRLVINEKGIYLRDPQLSYSMVLIPWQEIESVDLKSVLGKNNCLVLNLRSTSQLRRRLSILAKFTLTMRRIFRVPEFMVPIKGLDTRSEEIHSLILKGIELYAAD